MDIQTNDTLLTVRLITSSPPAKRLATISANGEIWIDPEITLDECKFVLKYVLEDYARKLTSRAPDSATPWTCRECGYRNNGFHKICGGCKAPRR